MTLHGRYSTIVADPPWAYDEGWPVNRGSRAGTRIGLPYPAMTVEAIAALGVAALARADCHLFLWTTHRYLDNAFDVARAWGFRPSSTLTWCKEPVGVGPGGLFAVTSEFVIYARRGKPEHFKRVGSTWWRWPRGGHSQKPDAFADMVEATVPGPYLEMFARRQRLGWDTWGNEALEHVSINGTAPTEPLAATPKVLSGVVLEGAARQEQDLGVAQSAPCEGSGGEQL